MTYLAILKQQPIIDMSGMAQIGEKVKERLSVYNFEQLVVDEENVKAIKKLRTELGSEFKTFEEARKSIKQGITDPYTQFENSYKDNVANLYKDADAKLKRAIDEVEDGMKQAKREEVKRYFDDLKEFMEIDFVTFEQANINVTLTASMKSLKEQAQQFLERIESDLVLIESQEHSERILVAYKSSLNVSHAITSVLEAVKQEEQLKASREVKTEPVVVAEPTPTIIKPVEVEKEMKMTFTVYGTITQLKSIKNYLESEGIRYE